MQKQEAAVAATLRLWELEQITLLQLLARLQAEGWKRRQVFAYLEREADAMAGRQSLGNRPKTAGLRN